MGDEFQTAIARRVIVESLEVAVPSLARFEVALFAEESGPG